MLAADVFVDWQPLNAQPLPGETVDVSVSFSNSGDTTGFGPYVEVLVPGGEVENNGLHYVGGSASMLGAGLAETVVQFDSNGFATHPFAKNEDGSSVVLQSSPNDQLIVFELPFGSFAPDQPEMQVDMQFFVDPDAETGESLELSAMGSLRYGNDALDNSSDDPTLVSEASFLTVTPELIRTEIEYLGPESETATGENFVQSYRVTFDLVEGLDVDTFQIMAEFDNNEVFLGIRDSSFDEQVLQVVSSPPVGEPSEEGKLVLQADQWSGVAGVDGSFVFDVYLPLNDSQGEFVVDPVVAGDSLSTLSVVASGNALHSEDAPAEFFETTPVKHELQGELLAVQQSVRILEDTNAGTLGPGDLLGYGIEFQLSDYAILDDLSFEFDIPDGQLLDESGLAVLTLDGLNQTGGQQQSFTFALEKADNWQPSQQIYQVDVVKILTDLGLETRLMGGLTSEGLGTAVTGSISYRATVQDDFVGDVPSGDLSIDEGDLFKTSVIASANTIDPETGQKSEFSTADDSGTRRSIRVPRIETSVFAINGVSNPERTDVKAGDLVTYRVAREIQSSDIENLVLSQFLPMPVFTVPQLNWNVANAVEFQENTIQLGPNDSFHEQFGQQPEIEIDSINNSFSLDYGDNDWSQNQTTTIDLLVTVRIQDQPFVDGLLLSSLANSSQGSSNSGNFSSNAITEIQYTRPNLTIQKNAVGSDNPAARLVGNSASGIDIQNVDAGDRVRFEIQIENVGTSEHGAWDVWIKDHLPLGFIVPADGIGLQIMDESGQPVSYQTLSSGLDSDLFDAGIRLLEPIDAADPLNQVLVTYELIASDEVFANAKTNSDAQILHYAAIEGGENFVTSPLVDSASVQIAGSSITHRVVSTDQIHTPDRNVVIGETITYKATINLPEGQMGNTQLQLKTVRGMAFEQLVSVTLPDSVTAEAGDASSILANASISNVGNDIRNGGRILTLDLGDLINEDRNNANVEAIEVVYTATITNDPNNDKGDNRKVNVTWSHDTETRSQKSNTVKIVEPILEVAKSQSKERVDAGDFYTIQLKIEPVQHLGTDAFDVVLREEIPEGTSLVDDSFRWISGEAPDELQMVDGVLFANWGVISLEQTSVLEYDVWVAPDISADTDLVSSAEISWSSLPGMPGQISAYNGLTVERTGDSSDVGGDANDYQAEFDSEIMTSSVLLNLELVNSSEAHTTGNELTIGEQAEFDIVLTVPEGSNPITLLASNFGSAAEIQVESLEILAVSENLTLSNAQVGEMVYADSNGNLIFDLGTVENPVDNLEAPADQIVIRLVGFIPDSSINRAGDEATVSVAVDYGTGTDTKTSSVEIVEPLLVLEQQLSDQQVDAADTIGVSLTIAHVNAESPTAFVLNLNQSMFDAGLRLIPESVSVSGGELISGSSDNDFQWKVVSDSLSNNESIVLSYQLAVGEEVAPGSTFLITPQLSYESILDESGRTYTTSVSSSIEVNSSTIAGTVFLDENQDGVEQFGDRGIGGTTVALIGVDHLGNSVQLETQTLTTGYYEFSGLRPGTYSLVESQPNTLFDGMDFAGSVGGEVGNDRIDSIQLVSGQSTTAVNYRFTESPLTWIEGTVFVDENEDGLLGKDEEGIAGVEITLEGLDEQQGWVSQVTTTNDRGYYVFGYLNPGTYQITEGATPGYFDAAEQLGTNGGEVLDDRFESIQISATSPGKMYNFGEYDAASLTGQLYIDYDRDAVLDRKDGLIAGIEVKLDGINDLGETVSQVQTTNLDGTYRFDSLRPGKYQVSTYAIDGLDRFVSNVGDFLGGSNANGNLGIGIEYGFEDVRLTPGAQAVAYNIGYVDPTFDPSIMATNFDSQTAIYGSNGNDNFVATITNSDATIRVNETEYRFSSDESHSIRLLGSFGNDSLSFTGSENKETIELRKHSARITGTWFETLVYGMENINVTGGGNEDLARFYDTAGNDLFDAVPFAATMKGEGYSNSVEGIHRIYAYMTEGVDHSNFSGQSGVRDNFHGSTSEAKLYNKDFYLSAKGYDSVHATATDATDRAWLYGSDGNDSLQAGESLVQLESGAFSLETYDYRYVSVSAGEGGTDSAVLSGSETDDFLNSRPTQAVFDVGYSRLIAKRFETIEVHSNGGDDVANLRDSHDKDQFVADLESATITNAINETTVLGFTRVNAYMDAGGEDTAIVSGSDQRDVFKASPEQWTMKGSGASLLGRGFTSVTASGQSTDKAYLYDSEYDDTLELDEYGATLRGQRFANSAFGFGKVNSEASDGNDRVIFHDSQTRTTFRMNEEKATLFGAGFSYNATGFDGVDAYFDDLDGRDRLDLDGRIDHDLTALDLAFAKFKLSLAFDEDSDDILLNSDISELPF